MEPQKAAVGAGQAYQAAAEEAATHPANSVAGEAEMQMVVDVEAVVGCFEHMPVEAAVVVELVLVYPASSRALVAVWGLVV